MGVNEIILMRFLILCLALVVGLLGCHSTRVEKNDSFCRVAEAPSRYTGKVVTVRLRVLASIEGSAVYDESCPKVSVALVPESANVRIWDEFAEVLNYGMADATAHADFTGTYTFLPSEPVRHRIVVRAVSHIEVHKGIDP